MRRTTIGRFLALLAVLAAFAGPGAAWGDRPSGGGGGHLAAWGD